MFISGCFAPVKEIGRDDHLWNDL